MRCSILRRQAEDRAMRCTSVVIADRHPVLLQGLNRVLGAEPDFNIVASCGAGADCIDAIRRFGPDIAIVDVAMPGLAGLKILSLVNSNRLSTQVVFFAATVEDCELVDVRRSQRLQHHSERCGAQGLGTVPAADRGWSEAVAIALIRPCRLSGAKRDRGECADNADGPRAADYASGFRRTVEQGNWTTAEYCRRHHQGASSQHLSKARNQ